MKNDIMGKWKKLVTEVSFFLTELFFSAKIVARSVLFPFIVEAAEIFVKVEEKVYDKLKERFIKNKTGW